MTCLDEAELGRYLRGQLPPDRALEVEAHLAGCDACAQKLASLPADQSPQDGEESIPTPLTREERPRWKGSPVVVMPRAAEGAVTPQRPAAPIEEGAPGGLVRGTAVGRYLIIEPLGEGGMGTVYEAYDPELSRKVAVKLLKPAAPHSRGQDQIRLLREAQAMARVSHPNVLAVYDVGTHGERVFVAMELVEGGTLKDWLSERPRTWKEIRDVYLAAGRGLAAAHAAGLIHRDFKPANVLIGKEGRARVTDFGLARLADGAIEAPSGESPDSDLESTNSGVLAEPLTRAGTVMGTPHYMSPEQHLGQLADARSDQFSFCAALYYALYRRRPFEPAKLAAEAARAEEAKEPTQRDRLTERIHPLAVIQEPPHDVRVPKFLRRVVMRGLSISAADRYASMDALLADLEVDPAAKRLRVAGIAAVGAVLVASGVGYVQAQRGRGQLCTGAEAQLAGIWDADVRAKLEAGFAETKHPLAGSLSKTVGQLFDKYAAQWASSHGEACRATRIRGEQTEHVLSLRMVCLERRRKDLRALAGVLVTPDVRAVERAVDAVTALPSVGACDDVEQLSQKVPLPDDPKVRERVEALQTQLAEAKALRAAGRYPPALEGARAVAKQAEELRYRPLIAEADYALGWLLDATGDSAGGEKQLMRALWAAEAARDDELRVEALGKLVFSVGYHQRRYADGEAWAAYARACIERLGGNEALDADLAQNLGSVYLAESKYEPAREELERALGLIRKLHGPEHPKVAYVLSNLGTVYLNQRDYARAADVLAQALALIERTKGPEHVSAGLAHGNLATALAGAGRFAEAHQHAGRALEIRKAVLGPEHPAVADSLDILADVYVRERRYAEGAAKYQEALALKEKIVGPDHPDLGFSLDGIGQAHLEAGECEKAIPWYQRAVKVRKDDRALAAESRFGLARAVWGSSPKRRAEGISLAEACRADYAALGMDAEVAKVDAWLAGTRPKH